MTPRPTLRTAASCACALAAVAYALAAPARAAADSVTYIVNNHNQTVTVKDGSGGTLFSRHISTPNVIALLTRNAPATGASVPTLPPRFTVEDANGLRLWSATIPLASPMRFHWNFDTGDPGTRFSFAHSDTPANASPDASGPPPKQLAVTLGGDGSPLNFKVDDKTYPFTRSPNGFSMDTPAGKIEAKTTVQGIAVTGPSGSGASIAFNKNGKGGTMTINGETIPLTVVKLNGKEYSSFPWNGHTVRVQDGCTYALDFNGDLTIDAPATAK